MRKSNPLDPILTKAVQSVLAATLMQPDRWWYLSDLARFLHCSPSCLQGALAALTKAGILHRKQEGNRVYYQADRRCPFGAELSGLITKTVGLLDVLKAALAPYRSRITTAFVYGSVARSEERSSSDVDLAIIGDTGLFDIATPLRKAEERIGRPVNATVWTQREFKKKLSGGDHFVNALIRGEKLMVIGNDEWMEKARGRRTG